VPNLTFIVAPRRETILVSVCLCAVTASLRFARVSVGLITDHPQTSQDVVVRWGDLQARGKVNQDNKMERYGQDCLDRFVVHFWHRS
jgi:hypothetical protein